MANASGGVETSKVTTYTSGSGTGDFGEVYSKGNANAVTGGSIPTTPTGNGWIYYPGAGTFATGNWSPVITMSQTNNADSQTFRIFKRSGGVYTAIGTITFTLSTSSKHTYTLTPTSMATFTLGASDGVYFDLWYQNSFSATGDSVTIYEATTSTAGVVSDLQVTTSNFTASGGGGPTHFSIFDGYSGFVS